jgi:glycosyltransferase involved in cell wall biosynthesis
MNIGFDAKRAYQNYTGLGNYSRTLLASLSEFYPGNNYYLFAPNITGLFNTSGFGNIYPVGPSQFPDTTCKSLWRSNWVKKELIEYHIDLYHGLSHEIPIGIAATGIKSVVTIHDLIFERFPKQYNPVDRFIYRNKFRYACKHADKIIAVSRQTKADLIDFYKIPAEKIDVCYQSCNPQFCNTITQEKKEAIRLLYQLPERFYLYVGSVIERKNLMLICKALKKLNSNIPLVVIGDGGAYKKKVKKYIAENGLWDSIIFLSETPAAKSSEFYKSSFDFPAIYQMATALIYPSMFEGFGIPVLEAMFSRLPVISSKMSCLPETGGNAALFVEISNENELAAAMQAVANDSCLRNSMIEKGIIQSQYFTQQKCADTVMEVYKKTFSDRRQLFIKPNSLHTLKELAN